MDHSLRALRSFDLSLQSLCITVEILNSRQKEFGVCLAMFQPAEVRHIDSSNSNQMSGAQPYR